MTERLPEPTDPTETPSDRSDTTWAGNRSLDSRWWWSPALWIVVGLGVIAYQLGAYLGEGGMWLNAVMIAIGAGVALSGLVQLKRAHAEHVAARQDSPGDGTGAV